MSADTYHWVELGSHEGVVDGWAPPIWRSSGYSASADHYHMGMWPSLGESADFSREARNLDFLNIGSVFLKKHYMEQTKCILRLNIVQEPLVYNLWSRIKDVFALVHTLYLPTC